MGIIAVIAVFFILVMVIDCNRFVVREYTCASDKLQKDGKFILLSDLHNKSFGKNNEKLLKAIEKENPDVILIAGDMYTSARNEDNMPSAEFVCRLAKKYPVYYGNGNHEHKTRLFPEIFGTMYQDYMEKVKGAGTVTLVNERVTLPAYNIDIYGLEIERPYYKKFVSQHMEESYLEGLLGRVNEDRFNLLIAHNPDYFETYADWGADLTVSGHVHGGLMVLPVLGGVISPRLRLFPHYDGGRFEKDGKEMILSRGLGTHTLPVRIFNPGELVVIRLKRK
ncbi:MAG: metallophosphoesterase [Suilimivivens sp.]